MDEAGAMLGFGRSGWPIVPGASPGGLPSPRGAVCTTSTQRSTCERRNGLKLGGSFVCFRPFRRVVLLAGIALLARGGIVGSYTLIIGHVHAAASGVALLVAFVVLLALFGGGKSGGSSGK
jgi:hypothetical protein